VQGSTCRTQSGSIRPVFSSDESTYIGDVVYTSTYQKKHHIPRVFKSEIDLHAHDLSIRNTNQCIQLNILFREDGLWKGIRRMGSANEDVGQI